MAKRKQQSSIGARGIGMELKQLREDRNVTCTDVGRALGVSGSTISRIETGKREPSSEEVASIATLLGITGVERMHLLDMVRRQDGEGLLDSVTSTEQSRNFRNFEIKATKITNFELALVPGLAQTNDYAHAVLSELRVGDDDDNISEWVGFRMYRQSLLTRKKPPEIHWILTELALRQPVGGAKVMARQIHKLMQLAEEPNITINIIPVSVATHPGLLGQFVILDFPSDPTVVYVEDRTTGLFLDRTDKVARYRLTVEKLMGVALDTGASLRLLKSIASDLE